jgi:hypothetical protein
MDLSFLNNAPWPDVLNFYDAVALSIMTAIILYNAWVYRAMLFWSTLALGLIFLVRTIFFYWAGLLGIDGPGDLVNSPVGKAVEHTIGIAMMCWDFVELEQGTIEIRRINRESKERDRQAALAPGAAPQTSQTSLEQEKLQEDEEHQNNAVTGDFDQV